MQIIFFSSNLDTLSEWKYRYKSHALECYDIESLKRAIKNHTEYLVIVDFDTKNTDINKMIASNTIIDNLIVLEKIPEIVTGKMLISHGIKAYGNARMLLLHYKQMVETVVQNKVWTYPELTAALVVSVSENKLSADSQKLIEHRLSKKEKEVLLSVLDGLTNDAIATKLAITTRTVKAHMSSIFTKLHVNDRIGLVLLLK